MFKDWKVLQSRLLVAYFLCWKITFWSTGFQPHRNDEISSDQVLKFTVVVLSANNLLFEIPTTFTNVHTVTFCNQVLSCKYLCLYQTVQCLKELWVMKWCDIASLASHLDIPLSWCFALATVDTIWFCCPSCRRVNGKVDKTWTVI